VCGDGRALAIAQLLENGQPMDAAQLRQLLAAS
jgi:hypothetical protein